jgi:hypothetical protein
MTDQSEVRSLGKRRRTALRVFYGFVVAAIASFTWEPAQAIRKA